MTGAGLLGIIGTASIELTGACPEDCLGYMARHHIRFRDYQKTDPLTATLTVGVRDVAFVKQAAKQTMCDFKLVRYSGIVPGLEAMGLRILYMGLLGLLLILVLFLQQHIFFFEVEGNTTIPGERILQILEDNGIGFGTSTKRLDMNTLKNQVLARIPELEFFTINLEGPIARVIVRQREEKPEASASRAPANIVASRGGIIETITPTGGTPQVKPGDVVSTGQLLISGITNLDKILLVSRAQGEVTARTFVEKRAIMENTILKKQYTGRESKVFSVTFGKNTINFYKSSGISYDNYDKMTLRKPLTLPGGYSLPLAVCVTTLREYTLQQIPAEEELAEQYLSEAMRKDTLSELRAGVILKTRQQLRQEADSYSLVGMMECREEIGLTVEIEE